ncbi:hypothetical protein [Paraburkholderia flava]|uniref:hypothetical protein n=1 Tax=Paraburkholderia flava TaxID=2547393 RepID=UPI0010602381|nr:hypothetical protein [Paraburkholderia flava]
MAIDVNGGKNVVFSTCVMAAEPLSMRVFDDLRSVVRRRFHFALARLSRDGSRVAKHGPSRVESSHEIRIKQQRNQGIPALRRARRAP